MRPRERFIGRQRTREVHAFEISSILVTEVGNFPVPVMGYGASPILGM